MVLEVVVPGAAAEGVVVWCSRPGCAIAGSGKGAVTKLPNSGESESGELEGHDGVYGGGAVGDGETTTN